MRTETAVPLSRSLGPWALAIVINLLLVGLAVAGTVAAALATVGEADSPPALSEPLFHGISVVLWVGVGWVAGFLSGVLGAPRGARWSGVVIVAVAGAVIAAWSGDSGAAQIVVLAALTAVGVVVGARAVPRRDASPAPL